MQNSRASTTSMFVAERGVGQLPGQVVSYVKTAACAAHEAGVKGMCYIITPMSRAGGIGDEKAGKVAFQDEAHEALFRERARLTARGGEFAPTCGARTRTGGACPNPPIREGKGRCLNHAGPKAANEHHERLWREFRSGKLSPADWHRREAKRAANRLHDNWKKDPWLPGRTIDLGPAEGDMTDALRDFGVDVAGLAPAVADWLRWRYRRTQIDRTDAGAWVRAVRAELPKRVDKAGVRPFASESATEGPQGGAQRPAWKVGPARGGLPSKRGVPDQPKAPKVIRGKGYGRRGRPRTQPAGDRELAGLMELYRQNQAAVGPMLDRCATEGDKLALLRALRDYLADPNEARAQERWLSMVRVLRPT